MESDKRKVKAAIEVCVMKTNKALLISCKHVMAIMTMMTTIVITIPPACCLWMTPHVRRMRMKIASLIWSYKTRKENASAVCYLKPSNFLFHSCSILTEDMQSLFL
jgi:hypothetical protein